MKIMAGPISLVKPGWGLDRGTVTSLVANDSGGHPEVLAAQVICNAALSGVRVLMLLPRERDRDDVWKAIVGLLTDRDENSADGGISVGDVLRNASLKVLTHGLGWDEVDQAELVYAPELSVRQARQFVEHKTPAILVCGTRFGGEPPLHVRSSVIQVGGDALVIESEGIKVPVEYDPSGPIYRPA